MYPLFGERKGERGTNQSSFQWGGGGKGKGGGVSKKWKRNREKIVIIWVNLVRKSHDGKKKAGHDIRILEGRSVGSKQTLHENGQTEQKKKKKLTLELTQGEERKYGERVRPGGPLRGATAATREKSIGGKGRSMDGKTIY